MTPQAPREPVYRVAYEIRYVETELTRSLPERLGWSEDEELRLHEFRWSVSPSLSTLRGAELHKDHVESMDPTVVEVRNAYIETMMRTPVTTATDQSRT